jgi:AhpD family alkylhydroperoxidase
MEVIMKKKVLSSGLVIMIMLAASLQAFAQKPDSVYKEIDKFTNKIGEYCPELGVAFTGLYDSTVFTEGSLSVKQKELMALSIAIYSGCEMCVYYHTYGAMKHGAKKEELLEAAAVAYYMGGGPAFAYINYLFGALEEIASMKAQAESEK